jgi:Asp-tRNA(Asn)/Glu-tRNA(Gln) amidotransferase A subunit family amidase
MGRRGERKAFQRRGGTRDLVAALGQRAMRPERLRAAGCVLIGKTRTQEFAWGTIL